MTKINKIIIFLFIFLYIFPNIINAKVFYTDRVSISNSGIQGNTNSNYSDISDDGRFVVFESKASNLVPNDTNNKSDIFLYDRNNDIIKRISTDIYGNEGNGDSTDAEISNNGNYIVFSSKASNLVGNDINNKADIFVYNRLTNSIERVSKNNNWIQGDGNSRLPSISADGRYISFQSYATNLVNNDNNNEPDIFVYDRILHKIERISVNNYGVEANNYSVRSSISGDGKYVAFQSAASNLVSYDPNEKNDIFLYNRQNKTIKKISTGNYGEQANNDVYNPSISADGRYVTFETLATNLVPNDNNNAEDVFLYDRIYDTISIISKPMFSESNGGSGNAKISSDGRYIVFSSSASNLVSNDTNFKEDVFVYDRYTTPWWTNHFERVSVPKTGEQSNGISNYPSISKDGEYISYGSYATNLVTNDTNNKIDVFVAARVLIFDPSWWI